MPEIAERQDKVTISKSHAVNGALDEFSRGKSETGKKRG